VGVGVVVYPQDKPTTPLGSPAGFLIFDITGGCGNWSGSPIWQRHTLEGRASVGSNPTRIMVHARMAELVDAAGSKSAAERREGSSPSSRIDIPHGEC
jgi:hypothetical protein